MDRAGSYEKRSNSIYSKRKKKTKNRQNMNFDAFGILIGGIIVGIVIYGMAKDDEE